jgi:hypothetical protein
MKRDEKITVASNGFERADVLYVPLASMSFPLIMFLFREIIFIKKGFW